MQNIKIFQLGILISIIFSNAIFASDADSTKTTVATKGICVSYIRHGLQVGLENYYFQNEKYKIIGSASLLFQRMPTHYSSAGLILTSTLRRTKKSGWYNENSIYGGYLGSYYDFDLYKTKSDGTIVNVGRSWMSSVILGISVGLGYDFSKKTKINLQVFFKPGLYYRYPNNDSPFYNNDYTIEIGLILHPKWIK